MSKRRSPLNARRAILSDGDRGGERIELPSLDEYQDRYQFEIGEGGTFKEAQKVHQMDLEALRRASIRRASQSREQVKARERGEDAHAVMARQAAQSPLTQGGTRRGRTSGPLMDDGTEQGTGGAWFELICPPDERQARLMGRMKGKTTDREAILAARRKNMRERHAKALEVAARSQAKRDAAVAKVKHRHDAQRQKFLDSQRPNAPTLAGLSRSLSAPTLTPAQLDMMSEQDRRVAVRLIEKGRKDEEKRARTLSNIDKREKMLQKFKRIPPKKLRHMLHEQYSEYAVKQREKDKIAVQQEWLRILVLKRSADGLQRAWAKCQEQRAEIRGRKAAAKKIQASYKENYAKRMRMKHAISAKIIAKYSWVARMNMMVKHRKRAQGLVHNFMLSCNGMFASERTRLFCKIMNGFRQTIVNCQIHARTFNTCTAARCALLSKLWDKEEARWREQKRREQKAAAALRRQKLRQAEAAGKLKQQGGRGRGPDPNSAASKSKRAEAHMNRVKAKWQHTHRQVQLLLQASDDSASSAEAQLLSQGDGEVVPAEDRQPYIGRYLADQRKKHVKRKKEELIRMTVQMEAVSAKDIASTFFSEEEKKGAPAKKAGKRGRRSSFFKKDKKASDGPPSGFFYFMYLTLPSAKHDFRACVRTAIRHHIRKASTATPSGVTPQPSVGSLGAGGKKDNADSGAQGKEAKDGDEEKN